MVYYIYHWCKSDESPFATWFLVLCQYLLAHSSLMRHFPPCFVPTAPHWASLVWGGKWRWGERQSIQCSCSQVNCGALVQLLVLSVQGILRLHGFVLSEDRCTNRAPFHIYWANNAMLWHNKAFYFMKMYMSAISMHKTYMWDQRLSKQVLPKCKFVTSGEDFLLAHVGHH